MESLEFGGFIWILWVTLTPRNIKLNELKKKKPKTPKNYILMNFWKMTMKIGPMIPHVVQTNKMTVQYMIHSVSVGFLSIFRSSSSSTTPTRNYRDGYHGNHHHRPCWPPTPGSGGGQAARLPGWNSSWGSSCYLYTGPSSLYLH